MTNTSEAQSRKFWSEMDEAVYGPGPEEDEPEMDELIEQGLGQLTDAVAEVLDDEGADLLAELARNVEHVRTFTSEGMLTMNRGVTLVMADGSEFQLSIVRSKR